MSRSDISKATGRVPGEPGVWILIFGDLLVFGVFFCTFAYYHGQEPAVFRASQAALNQGLGLLNTLLLLTSSLAVVLALESKRNGAPASGRRWASLALCLGAGFVVVKAVEYGEKIAAGIYPVTNDFFMLYFAFTGIHLLHVIVGLGVLAFLRTRIREQPNASDVAIVEGCGLFWHLVDILWVVLFAILYLHR